MSAISKNLECSKKIVVKIGSNVLSDENGRVKRSVIQNLADQISDLIRQQKQVILVSSGAGICGVGAINKWSRRNDIHYKQALCAIGQVELMMAYKKFFGAHQIHVGQMLLTRGDFTEAQRTLNVRNTLFTLVDEGVLPVINENDTVSVDEIKIGDNDTLSALTAVLWNADLLVCLSDIDGVFDQDPKSSRSAALIEEVSDIDALLEQIDVTGKSSFGTGGILTKIEAARRAGKYGIPTILLNGKKPDVIMNALQGKETGTCFLRKEIR